MTLLRHMGLPLAVACCLVGGAALAQTPSDADLQALRFYMSESNQQAVNSEIRRLQLQYPDWVVPDDLGQIERSVPGEMIDRIYRQVDAGQFEGARGTIAEISREYPNWSPSADLLETLALSEAQASFDEAVSGNNADVAIRVARANPALLRCERVNNAWLLAEQYQSIGDVTAALGVYTGIARSCTDPDALVATLEKSADVATLDQLARLADLARSQSPATADRLTSVEDRLRAGMLAQGQIAPATSPLDPLSTVEISPATGSSPAVSLRPVGRPQRAASLQRPASSAPATTAPASLSGARSAAQRGDWASCLAESASARDAETVAQRGWCALNSDRPMQALADFKAAASSARSAQTRRDASYGQALVMLRLNMVDEAAAVAAGTHLTAEQRLEIESQILDKRGVAAYNRRDFRRAIAYFDELERVTGVVRRDLALLRGYAYLNSGQKAQARIEFQRLHDQMATPASRRALSDALR